MADQAIEQKIRETANISANPGWVSMNSVAVPYYQPTESGEGYLTNLEFIILASLQDIIAQISRI